MAMARERVPHEFWCEKENENNPKGCFCKPLGLSVLYGGDDET